MTITTEPDPANGNADQPLDSIRSILLSSERERISRLEAKAEDLHQEGNREREALQAEIDRLKETLAAVQVTATTQAERADRLQQELSDFRQHMKAESEAMVPNLIQRLGHIISQTIRNSREEMAEALGPIMGDAIRVQIRDSRQEMVEALYPIILDIVQRAVSEFAREFQRNIDERLRQTFGPQGILRTVGARLRGVSPAELALRDSLPSQLEQLFLIQHGSGLLLAHSGPPGVEDDPDLVGGMLTAIRAFASDTFGRGSGNDELEEIQYGDRRIIIQSGEFIYLAAVVAGVEPEGFRSRLRRFVNQMHHDHRPALRDYAGDSAGLSEATPLLAALADDLQPTAEQSRAPMSRGQKLLLAGGGLGLILVLALACFYLQFTIALLPLAFGQATPTPDTIVITATSQSFAATPAAETTPATSTPTPSAPAALRPESNASSPAGHFPMDSLITGPLPLLAWSDAGPGSVSPPAGAQAP